MKKTKINILSLFNTTKNLPGSKSGTAPSSTGSRTTSPVSTDTFNFIGKNGSKNGYISSERDKRDFKPMKGPSVNRNDEGFGSDARERGIED
jgi:hypothetical protein